MYQVEHSAILLTFIKLPFVNNIFVLPTSEWLLQTDFTVQWSGCLFLQVCPSSVHNVRTGLGGQGSQLGGRRVKEGGIISLSPSDVLSRLLG